MIKVTRVPHHIIEMLCLPPWISCQVRTNSGIFKPPPQFPFPAFLIKKDPPGNGVARWRPQYLKLAKLGNQERIFNYPRQENQRFLLQGDDMCDQRDANLSGDTKIQDKENIQKVSLGLLFFATFSAFLEGSDHFRLLPTSLQEDMEGRNIALLTVHSLTAACNLC